MKTIICIALAAVSLSAQAGIVVVGHPGAAPLTKEQVADIYLAKDLSAKPVDQPESAAIRTDFYKKATGREPAQAKAIWSRIVFSGKGQMPKEAADAAAVKKAVAADPKAVGYIDSTQVDDSVKVLLAID